MPVAFISSIWTTGDLDNLASIYLLCSSKSVFIVMGSLKYPLFSRCRKQKIISGYWTAIDYRKLGFSIQTLIEINIQPTKFDTVLQKVLQTKPQFTYELTGEPSILIDHWLENIEDLRLLLRENLGKIDGIQQIITHLVLKNYRKRTALVSPSYEKIK